MCLHSPVLESDGLVTQWPLALWLAVSFSSSSLLFLPPQLLLIPSDAGVFPTAISGRMSVTFQGKNVLSRSDRAAVMGECTLAG